MKSWLSLLLLSLTAHGQFITRSVIKPPHVEKPFSLSFDCPNNCLGATMLSYGLSTGAYPFLADISFTNGVCTIWNLYRTNTYYFDFINGDCGSGDLVEVQWRPPRTNYVTVSLAGMTNCITWTNPGCASQFYRLRGTSMTGADLLATDNPLHNLWLKVGAFSYPSSAVPNLVVTASNSWAGIEAYEHPQK